MHTHRAKAGTVGRQAAATVRPRPVTVHTFPGHVLDGYFPGSVEEAFLAAERLLGSADRRTDRRQPPGARLPGRVGVGAAERWLVVPFGLERGPFAAVAEPSGRLRRRLGLGADVPLVGAVGRLVPIKDLITLVRAVAPSGRGPPGAVGEGEARPELRSVRRLPGPRRAGASAGLGRRRGRLDADLDVVALTIRNEGTPVALIEALAAGRPAVATSVGGVPFVQRSGGIGWLVPPSRPPWPTPWRRRWPIPPRGPVGPPSAEPRCSIPSV